MDVDILPATVEQLPRILSLLADNALPDAGIARHLDSTLVAVAESDLAACGAVEIYDSEGLLRSITVDRRYRGGGLGSRLTREVMGLSEQRGIQDLYLLTETARDFFFRFGFREVERDVVPSSIRATEEFSVACPTSATVMRASFRSGRGWGPAGRP